MKPLRIALVDDHQIFRAGLKNLIEQHPNWEVRLEGGNGHELLEQLPRHKIDLVITDIQMPGMDGFELTRIVKRDYKGIRVMVLSMHAQVYLIQKMLDLGACGYVLKEAHPQDLLRCIEHASADRPIFCQESTNLLIKSALRRKDLGIQFTDRDFALSELLLKEKSDEDIAQTLGLTTRRVKDLVQDLIDKTHVKTRVGLVRWMLENGLRDTGEHLPEKPKENLV